MLQCIELEAHAILGAGQEHAKWSPVATAWYRLQPEVVLLQPVTGDDAQQLAKYVPELFSVQDGQLVVGEARQHEHKLEQVGFGFEAAEAHACARVTWLGLFGYSWGAGCLLEI
eukprot:GHRR01031476.1.p1 GENE.GHRR01031476.1~~GHRR01031476.1.p1  ORF type:complete len:114 (+),score=34.73 GHRR01031476.1:366-707(+)